MRIAQSWRSEQDLPVLAGRRFARGRNSYFRAAIGVALALGGFSRQRQLPREVGSV
jgi:hypothetical protein